LALFPHMTVRENISFGLKMQRLPKQHQEKKADSVIELLRIKYLENRYPHNLSGGEKQKVALARTLAMDSPIILLDEPLASIDAESSRQIRRELKQIHKEQKKTVVHVTHSLIDGFSLADKLALIQTGEIVQVGYSNEVSTNPKNEFAARLLGYENVFKAELVETMPDFSLITLEEIKLLVSGIIEHVSLVAIRPEDISVSLLPAKKNKINVLRASISDYLDLGPFVMVDAYAEPLTFKVILTKNFFMENELEVEKQVWLTIKPEIVKIIQ